MTALQSRPAAGPSEAGSPQDSRSTPVSLRETGEGNPSSPINPPSRSLPPYVPIRDKEGPEDPQSPEAQPLEHQGQAPHDPAPQNQEPQGQQPQGQQPQGQQPQSQHDDSQEPQIEEPEIQEPQVQEAQIQDAQVPEPQIQQHESKEPQIEEPLNQQDKSQEPQTEEPEIQELQAQEAQIQQHESKEPQNQQHKSQESQIEEPQNQQHKSQKPEIQESQGQEPQGQQHESQEPQIEEPQIQQHEIQPEIQEPEVQEPQSQEPESSTVMDEPETAQEDLIVMTCCQRRFEDMRDCDCKVPQGPSSPRAPGLLISHWSINCYCFCCAWVRESTQEFIPDRRPGRSGQIANPTYNAELNLDEWAERLSPDNNIVVIHPILLQEETQNWGWVAHTVNETEIPYLVEPSATYGIWRVTLNEKGIWIALHRNGTSHALDFADRPATNQLYPDYGYAPGVSPYGPSGDSTSSLDPSEVNPEGYVARQPQNKCRAYSTDQENTTLFIGGINGSVTDVVILELFLKFGQITYLKKSHQTSAFVQYVQRRDAKMAMRQLQGAPVFHCRLRISWGDPKRMNQWNITPKKGPLPFKGGDFQGHQRTRVMRQGNAAQMPQHYLRNCRYQQPNQNQGYHNMPGPYLNQQQQQYQMPQNVPQNGWYQQPNQYLGYNNMQGPYVDQQQQQYHGYNNNIQGPYVNQQQQQDQVPPMDIPPDNHHAWYPQHGWQYPEQMGDDFGKATQHPSPVAPLSTPGGSQPASPQSAQSSHPSGSGNGKDPLAVSSDVEPDPGQGPANQEPSIQEPADQAPASREPTNPESIDQESIDQESIDQESIDQESIDQESTNQEPTSQEPSGQESSDQELSEQEPSKQRDRAPSRTRPDQTGASSMEGQSCQTAEDIWSEVGETFSETPQTRTNRARKIIVRLPPKTPGDSSQTQ